MLVSTTVVEVGVDVANATGMVVLDADRFGVSQLHQLRGRVGRGEAPGLCLLVTDTEAGSPARERLDAVAATLDGFELSRLDLEARREGDVLGASQSGRRSSLRLLRVLRDEDLIVDARDDAAEVVGGDPDLRGHAACATRWTGSWPSSAPTTSTRPDPGKTRHRQDPTRQDRPGKPTRRPNPAGPGAVLGTGRRRGRCGMQGDAHDGTGAAQRPRRACGARPGDRGAGGTRAGRTTGRTGRVGGPWRPSWSSPAWPRPRSRRAATTRRAGSRSSWPCRSPPSWSSATGPPPRRRRAGPAGPRSWPGSWVAGHCCAAACRPSPPPASRPLPLMAAAVLAARRRPPPAGRRARVVVHGLLGVGALTAVAGWAGVVLHLDRLAVTQDGMWRAGSTLTYPNAAAALLTLLCLPALALRLSRPADRWPAALCALLLVGHAATLSRAGAVSLAAGAVVLAACAGWRSLLQGALAPAVGALVGVAGLLGSVPLDAPAGRWPALLGLPAGMAVAAWLAPRRAAQGPGRGRRRGRCGRDGSRRGAGRAGAGPAPGRGGLGPLGRPRRRPAHRRRPALVGHRSGRRVARPRPGRAAVHSHPLRARRVRPGPSRAGRPRSAAPAAPGRAPGARRRSRVARALARPAGRPASWQRSSRPPSTAVSTSSGTSLSCRSPPWLSSR